MPFQDQDPEVEEAVRALTDQLRRAVERSVLRQLSQAMTVGGAPEPEIRRRGRPRKGDPVRQITPVKTTRPPQFCPVPGCKNKAAPLYGMVCKEHKSLPKAQIAKYREARKAAKRSGGPGGTNGAPAVVKASRARRGGAKRIPISIP